MKQPVIKEFGRVKNGQEAKFYILENETGASVCVTDFGAALVSLKVPDKNGSLTDVVLGYDDAAGYEAGTASFGAPVGRSANRIGGASVEINGVLYELEKNDNDNNLHSGTNYYNKRFWKIKEICGGKVTFSLYSPDGDQGYPGSLDMEVTYELTEDNEVRMSYHAVPDADTVINMTNHSYFNLNGHDSGDILGHAVTMDADYFTRANAQSIPTGEYVDVTGTPMDFRNGRVLGAEIDADYEATKLGCGYDHNWVLKNEGKFVKVAEAAGDKSGIVMEVSTDLPGVQIYTANFLDREPGKGGVSYPRRAAVCFETQYFPDAVHHANFKSPIVKAGQAYDTQTSYRFLVKK